MLDITQADLTRTAWDGSAIEFMIIDCMKRIEVAANIGETFFPALLPRVGIVAHQDYLHFFHSWIHILMYELRDYIVPLMTIPASSTVVFKSRKALPSGTFTFPRDFSEVPDGLIEEAFAWNAGAVDPAVHDAIAAANVAAYIHKGDMDKARFRFRDYTSNTYRDSRHFREMHDFFKRFNIVDLGED